MGKKSLPKNKSSFTRLTWFITALSLAMLTLLGAVVIERITQQTVLSTVSFLEQQVTALGDAYQLQIHNLRFMRQSLHQVDATPELTLYDAMSELIRDDSAIFLNAEHYQNYVGTADNLFVFLNLVMNAAEHPPKQITISSRTWGEKHFIWPMNHIFALDFAHSISKALPPLPSGQEGIGILPLLEVTQRPEEVKHYIIYGTLFLPKQSRRKYGHHCLCL